jgi:hypothetical protein
LSADLKTSVVATLSPFISKKSQNSTVLL